MGAPAGATTSLEVLVLGDLAVRREGRLLPLPPSRKTRGLLGFLAVMGRPQARQQLCDLLWDAPGDPRAALRWSLTKLRPLVDGDRARIAADKEQVAIALSPAELDLAVVQGCLPAAAAVEDLQRAASLFRGELLEGLDLADCHRFNEWCTAQRESARRQRLAILDALAEKLAAAGDLEEALASARVRLTVDPYAEQGHLAVVRLLGRLRRAREGLEQYETCRHILASTFGARPSPEMERARLALTASAPPPEPMPPPRAGQPPVPAGAPRPPPPGAPAVDPHPGRAPGARPAVAAPPLVGRGGVRAALAGAVETVAGERRCRVALLLGEPGMGKSRLLEEVASQAVAAGLIALRGRAFEAEALRPYGPWIDALRTAPLARLAQAQRIELAPLLPELGPTQPWAGDQGRLFDAVVRVLSSLAQEAPLVVALDDLHWADEPSAALLHYALRALEAAPVLFVVAARPGELADNPAALRTVRSLGRSERALRLDLPPLSPTDVARLTRSVAPSVDVARVIAESEGNPLFALLVARALGGGADEWRSVEALVDERLSAVAGRAREVLSFAAVLGRGFRADRLARVSGLPAGELSAALADLERQGIFRPSGEAGWDFAHDLFRRAAYAGISAPRRQLLHRAIARALAPLPDRDGALAWEVARHAALGNDAELAARAAVAAGERAARLFAVAEAEDIAERGLGFAARLVGQQRIAVSLALLRVLVDASRPQGGDAGLLPRIEALVEEARQEDLPAEVAVGLAILSHAHFANRDLPRTLQTTSDVVAALRGVDAAQAAVAMAETGGCLALLECDIPRARLLLAEARRFRELGGRAAVYVEGGTGIIQHLDGAAEEAAATLERTLQLAKDGAPWEECAFLGRLALINLELGRPERVAARTARMRAAAPRLNASGEALFAEALDLAAGRASGERLDERELDAALLRLEGDAKAHFAQLACWLAEGDLAVGRHAVARARLERACAAARAVKRTSLEVLSRALLARCALHRGDREAARAEVDAARCELGRGVPLAHAVHALDEVAQELGVHATPLPPPPRA